MKVSAEWLAMLDEARGGETRSGFVRRVMEGALGGASVEAVAGTVEARQAVRAVPAAPVTSPRAAGGARVHGSPALERFGGKS